MVFDWAGTIFLISGSSLSFGGSLYRGVDCGMLALCMKFGQVGDPRLADS